MARASVASGGQRRRDDNPQYNEPMLRFFVVSLLIYTDLLSAADAHAPRIDKPKLEAFLRYTETYAAQVKLVVDDPTPSAYPGFSRVLVHVSLGEQKIGDKLFYVTADGEHFLSGTVWDLNENPYQDILERIPSSGFPIGPANAKVTIQVFSDFECPYCRDFAKTLRDNIEKKYANDVRVIFHNFPLEGPHPWARAAAEAADCLGNEKVTAFWAFHDWIFDHQGAVNDVYKGQQATFATYLRSQTLEIAKAQNLDSEKVGSCMDRHATATQVEESARAGRALQIETTPTLFINGRVIPGAFPWPTLDAVIQIELNRPKEIPGAGVENCCK